MAGTFWFDKGGAKGFFHAKPEGMVLGTFLVGMNPQITMEILMRKT